MEACLEFVQFAPLFHQNSFNWNFQKPFSLKNFATKI